MRDGILAPLIDQAARDGGAYLDARTRLWTASDAHRTARGLRRRTAGRVLNAVADEHRVIEAAALRRWGSVPQMPEAIEPWANVVAQREADADPRITEACNRLDEARADQQRLTDRQVQEHAEIRSRM